MACCYLSIIHDRKKETALDLQTDTRLNIKLQPSARHLRDKITINNYLTVHYFQLDANQAKSILFGVTMSSSEFSI